MSYKITSALKGIFALCDTNHGVDYFNTLFETTDCVVAEYTQPGPTESTGGVELVKEAKKAEIEHWRDAACYADVTALGRAWQADARSQDLLNKAISLAGLGLPLPAIWRDADNDDMAVAGIMDLLQIAGAMASQTQTAYGISWTLKAQVDAATTTEEINAVVWP